MEPWLSIGVFVAAVAVATLWWVGVRRSVPTPSDDGPAERSAVMFAEQVLAELAARGVQARPVGGAFAVDVEGGRRLPLAEGFARYARRRVDSAAADLVAQWARVGWLGDRDQFRARVVERLVRDGQPAEPETHGFAVRIADAVVVLDAAFAELEPVPETIAAIAADVAWWRAAAPPLAEIDDALEVQVLPEVHVAREDLAARLRSLRAGVAWAGPQPVATLGAGWVARAVWVRRGLVKPVAAWAEAWGTTAQQVLERVVERAPTGGHPFRTWQPGVMQAALGDARDLRVLLLEASVFAQLGLDPPVVWPLQADRVVVAAGGDDDVVGRLLERAFDGTPIPEPLSWVPLVRGPDGAWRWLSVPPDHDLAPALDRLAGQQLQLEYAWLQPVLIDLAEAGEIPPPAALELDDDERPFARWDGEAALVPAEVHVVHSSEGVEDRSSWVARTGAVLRDDLGLPFLEVGG